MSNVEMEAVIEIHGYRFTVCRADALPRTPGLVAVMGRVAGRMALLSVDHLPIPSRSGVDDPRYPFWNHVAAGELSFAFRATGEWLDLEGEKVSLELATHEVKLDWSCHPSFDPDRLSAVFFPLDAV